MRGETVLKVRWNRPINWPGNARDVKRNNNFDGRWLVRSLLEFHALSPRFLGVQQATGVESLVSFDIGFAFGSECSEDFSREGEWGEAVRGDHISVAD
jgi:hypothetical protein